MSFILVSLLAVFSAHAGTITDNANFFSAFEQKLSTKTFSDLHSCNFKAQYNEGVEEFGVECNNDDGTGMTCAHWAIHNDMVYGKNEQSCSAEEQIIVNDKGGVETYSSSEFAAIKGNYAKKFLENLDTYLGYKSNITLDSFANAEMTIASQTPNERKIKVMNIKGHIDFIDYPYSLEFLMTVSENVPGAIQVLRFRLADTSFLRVLDF